MSQSRPASLLSQQDPNEKCHPKALILSFLAMVMTESLSALADPGNASVYLLIDTAMNVPRFLALGTVVGLLYGKLEGNAGT